MGAKMLQARWSGNSAAYLVGIGYAAGLPSRQRTGHRAADERREPRMLTLTRYFTDINRNTTIAAKPAKYRKPTKYQTN